MPKRPDIFSQVSSQRDVDDEAVTELRLYAENTGELYGQKQSIIENVKRRIAGGTYDPDLAPKLWLYWVDAAAQRYCKEFGCLVRRTFPLDARTKLAEELAADYEERVRVGEFGEVVKKRRSKVSAAHNGESFDVYVDDVLRAENLFRDEAEREVRRWLFAGNESTYALGTRGTRIDRSSFGAERVASGRARYSAAIARRPRGTSSSAINPSRKPSGHERGETPRRPYCLSLTHPELRGLVYAADRYDAARVLLDALHPVDESLDMAEATAGFTLGASGPPMWRGEELFCMQEHEAWAVAEAIEQEDSKSIPLVTFNEKLYEQVLSKIV